MLFALLSVAINIVGKFAVISNQNITSPSKMMTNTLSFVESIIGFGLMHYALSEVGNTGKIRISLCLAFIGFLYSLLLPLRK